MRHAMMKKDKLTTEIARKELREAPVAQGQLLADRRPKLHKELREAHDEMLRIRKKLGEAIESQLRARFTGLELL